MAIKGGVARRILKLLRGVPEPAGQTYDVDCLLFLPEGHGTDDDDGGGGGGALTPEERQAARGAIDGLVLGGLVLEPQDCEITTKVGVVSALTVAVGVALKHTRTRT